MRLAIISVLVIGVVVGGFMGYRLYDRHTIEQDFRASTTELVENLPIFTGAHDEVLRMFESLHAEAFAESFDFGGITSPASSDGQTYLEFVLRQSWDRVKGREDGDQAKILIYMFVTTRAITIDSRPLERNADMERAIREARGEAPR
jgi:hypothetical protein